jgi:hypothetical protein
MDEAMHQTVTDQDLWEGIDRRKRPLIPGGPEGKAWEYVIHKLEILEVKINAMHIDMTSHKMETHTMKTDVDAIKKAFPKDGDGLRDFSGHHDFHGDMIVHSQKWSDIWNDVMKKLFGGIAWVTVCFVAYSIWESIKNEAKK